MFKKHFQVPWMIYIKTIKTISNMNEPQNNFIASKKEPKLYIKKVRQNLRDRVGGSFQILLILFAIITICLVFLDL